MRRSRKWSNLLIVLATISLVLVPVFVPREVARWYLAAAANAFRLQDTVLGKHYLEKAVAWDASIQQDGDYWVAQLPPVDVRTPDGLLDMIEKAVAIEPAWGIKAVEAATILAEDYDFPRAVRAVKIAFQGIRPSASLLNLRAYYRSLADLELNEALEDINRAIKMQSESTEAQVEPALLDTKAWVLHRLDRNEEALELMNDAISRMEAQLISAEKKWVAARQAKQAAANKSNDQASPTNPTADVFDSDKAAPASPEPNAELLPAIRIRITRAKEQLGSELFSLAVLHFHRFKILKALEKHDEAKVDEQWLIDHDVPVVDELF